jgi:hypothetical protein
MASLKVLALLACWVVSGCASDKWRDVDAKSVTYAAQVPRGVSTAFMHGGDLWIVPEKSRNIVSASVDGIGQQLVSTGTYLKVRGFSATRITVQFSDGVTSEIQVAGKSPQP